MKKIKELRKTAVEFVEKAYSECDDDLFERVLPLCNGIVLRFAWENGGFIIHIYDYQFQIYVGNGITEHDLMVCIRGIQSAISDFYDDYICDCIEKYKTIRLPGCKALFWDKRKKTYYIQQSVSSMNRCKIEWIADAWEYVEKQAESSNLFWIHN